MASLVDRSAYVAPVLAGVDGEITAPRVLASLLRVHGTKSQDQTTGRNDRGIALLATLVKAYLEEHKRQALVFVLTASSGSHGTLVYYAGSGNKTQFGAAHDIYLAVVACTACSDVLTINGINSFNHAENVFGEHSIVIEVAAQYVRVGGITIWELSSS